MTIAIFGSLHSAAIDIIIPSIVLWLTYIVVTPSEWLVSCSIPAVPRISVAVIYCIISSVIVIPAKAIIVSSVIIRPSYTCIVIPVIIISAESILISSVAIITTLSVVPVKLAGSKGSVLITTDIRTIDIHFIVPER